MQVMVCSPLAIACARATRRKAVEAHMDERSWVRWARPTWCLVGAVGRLMAPLAETDVGSVQRLETAVVGSQCLCQTDLAEALEVRCW